jgi:hypothetical protein
MITAKKNYFSIMQINTSIFKPSLHKRLSAQEFIDSNEGLVLLTVSAIQPNLLGY